MKLDENVCRGSLIIHKGISYVVIGYGVHNEQAKVGQMFRGPNIQKFGWRIKPTADFKPDQIHVSAVLTINKDEEVEMFFPGVAFELPDYIK